MRLYNGYRPHMTNFQDRLTLEKDLFTLPVTLPTSPIGTRPPQFTRTVNRSRLVFSPDFSAASGVYQVLPKLIKHGGKKRAQTALKVYKEVLLVDDGHLGDEPTDQKSLSCLTLTSPSRLRSGKRMPIKILPSKAAPAESGYCPSTNRLVLLPKMAIEPKRNKNALSVYGHRMTVRKVIK